MTVRLKFLTLAALVALVGVAAPVAGAAQTRSRPISIFSDLGGKCLDAEGGSTASGTRIIGYACSGSWNQQFVVYADGTIRLNGKCLDAAGGTGREGDAIVLWDCNGGANQRWRYNSNRTLTGINSKCMDLEGGSGHWWGNQRVILWSCHAAANQRWAWGRVVPRSSVGSNTVVLPSGQQFPRDGRDLWPRVSTNVIATGGGNVISTGGGNVISTGGGNVIAVGGGN